MNIFKKLNRLNPWRKNKLLEDIVRLSRGDEYVDVPDYKAETYVTMEESLRTKRVKYWYGPWYKTPRALESEISFDEDEIINSSSTNIVDGFLKKTYPIQFFIRHTLWDNPITDFIQKWKWKFDRFYYEYIRTIFVNQGGWLVKKIPRTWADKPELLESVMFEFIINFVEDEECFKTINWDSCESHAEAAKVIREIYNWAKFDRPLIQYNIDSINYRELRYKFKESGLPIDQQYEFVYGKQNALEKQISDNNEKFLIELVKIRGFLWT